MIENKNETTLSPGERIQHLCDTHHLTRKKLALHLGVAPSQISRILNGDTKSINSDLLIKLAREFHVSTDYILGLHKDPQDTGYLPMLLMSTAFRPGECLNFIRSLGNQDMQKMAYCEYYYFTGEHDKAVNLAELYLNHPYPMLRLSACLIYTFANLPLNRINSATGGLKSLKENLNQLLKKEDNRKITALSIRAACWNEVMGMLYPGS